MASHPAKIYGLIGFPLGHSFSHGFFNDKFARESIDARYVNFELPSIADFPQVIADNPNLSGLNVTIPYKQKVIPYLDALDPEAEKIGAVNVIKIARDANGDVTSLTGYNSDIIGFTQSIKPLLKPEHKRALVLGTGGASKAVRQGLINLGIEPQMVSRTGAPGRITYADIDKAVVDDHLVIVNTTPVGMHPHDDECPDLPYQLLTPSHVCYDLVYNPDVTLFMRKSAEHGAVVKNGLEMLHLQAIAAWHIWNSKQ